MVKFDQVLGPYEQKAYKGKVCYELEIRANGEKITSRQYKSKDKAIEAKALLEKTIGTETNEQPGPTEGLRLRDWLLELWRTCITADGSVKSSELIRAKASALRAARETLIFGAPDDEELQKLPNMQGLSKDELLKKLEMAMAKEKPPTVTSDSGN